MFAIGDAEMFAKVEDERINFDTSEGKGLINYDCTNYNILKFNF